jgi:hypothetical protein
MSNPLPNLAFPAVPLEFNRRAQLVDPQQEQALTAFASAAITDLLVLSHGWNNDIAEADRLYANLAARMKALVTSGRHPLTGRSLGILAIRWPSKRFADDDLIPGGAASAPKVQTVAEQLTALRKSFDGSHELNVPPDPDVTEVLDRALALEPRLDTSPEARDSFGRLLRSLLSQSVNDEEPVLADNFFSLSGEELLERLARPFFPGGLAAVSTGGAAAVGAGAGATAIAAGGAAGLGNALKGIRNGARNLLNLFTYYEMKERAGKVGAALSPILVRLQAARPSLRLHLAGHSFGGRLVSAALAAEPAQNLKISSVTLLQAAFSHWGFAQAYDGHNDGFFRRGLDATRLVGPMMVTHSARDRAVGLAYPIASRLRNQVASGIGDASDPYGGIGRNGAQKTPEVVANLQLLGSGQSYGALQAGRIHNLNGDSNIKDHGDVATEFTAHAVLSAIEA